MSIMQALNKLRQLDQYPKINEDFYSRTLSGGLITIVSSVLMILLFFSELSRWSLSNPTSSLVPYGSCLPSLQLRSLAEILPSLTCWIVVECITKSGVI
jgi:hypothetical protein